MTSTCAHCGEELTGRWQNTYCSNTCSNLARYRETPVQGTPAHGHRWRSVWTLDEDGLSYHWVCKHCGDTLPADSPTEAFTYECEASRVEAA